MLNLQHGDLVSDGGCGPGYYVSGILEQGAVPIAVDWKTHQGIRDMREEQPKPGFLRADVQKLPFGDGVFDAVLLSSVLQMVQDDRALLAECHRVLKGSGVLVLSATVDYLFIDRLNAVKPQLGRLFAVNGTGYYSVAEVARLLKGRFRVIEIEYSPRLLGSLVYELELYFWYRFRVPFLSAAFYPLFGVFARLDSALGGSLGDEFIIKAQKI